MEKNLDELNHKSAGFLAFYVGFLGKPQPACSNDFSSVCDRKAYDHLLLRSEVCFVKRKNSVFSSIGENCLQI